MEQSLEKLMLTQIFRKFLTFYGARRFITVFARARYWFPSWARCIQSTKIHSVILYSHIWISLLGGLFPSGYQTKIVYACNMTPPSHPPWLDHPNNIWWSV